MHHATAPLTVAGGPHGLHPVGAVWVERHPDAADEGGASACRTCHGLDYRGTVLSRAQGERTFDTNFGRKHFWRGFQVGCYTCHQGPGGGGANPNHAPVVTSTALSTSASTTVSAALDASDADGDALSLRIVSQPEHGSVGIDGNRATFFPEADFTGTDRFTFAASDGSTDSELGTVTLTINPPPSPTPTPSRAPASATVTATTWFRSKSSCAAFPSPWKRMSSGPASVSTSIAAVGSASTSWFGE